MEASQEHFNLSELSLTVNEQKVPYAESLHFNFEKDAFLMGYNSLFTINPQNMKTGNNISPEAYKSGLALYGFDLTPDECGGNHIDVPTSGTFTIGLSFSKALEKTVTAIFYLQYNNTIEISKDSQVTFDYKV